MTRAAQSRRADSTGLIPEPRRQGAVGSLKNRVLRQKLARTCVGLLQIQEPALFADVHRLCLADGGARAGGLVDMAAEEVLRLFPH
jgi:hypothetical protein